MLTVDAVTLKDVLNVSLRQRRSLMLWGEAGVAKSAVVKQVAEENGADLITVHLSQYDSVDLRGIPSPKDGMTAWLPPMQLPFLGNSAFPTDRPIFLFLDELPQAMAAVQAPAMQLVLEHRIGEHQLMPNVWVVAAGNLETHKAGTHAMLTPLCNRFRHVMLVSSVAAWSAWANVSGIAPKLISFLNFRPTLLSTFITEGGKVTTDKAYCTGRTWEHVSNTIQDPKIGNAMRLMLNTGDVGEAAAGELESFLELFDTMPDMDELFKTASTASIPDASEPAMMYAISTAISVHCNTAKRFVQIAPYIERMPVEYGMRTIKDMVVRYPKLCSTPEFNAYAIKHQELFQ